MVLPVARVARPRRGPQLRHLLGEPALGRLAELQPWVRRLPYAAADLRSRVIPCDPRGRDRLDGPAPPLTPVGIPIADLEQAIRPPVDALIARDADPTQRA